MKILIVDDHTLFSEGLRHILIKIIQKVEIFEATNCKQAEKLLAESPDMDLVLLDLNLPVNNRFILLSSFTRQYPALPIVILSDSTESTDIQQALQAGAMGYIPKDTPSAVMLNILQLILSGGTYMPPPSFQSHTPGEELLEPTLKPVKDLTPRQIQVLSHLVQGDSNKKIASQLNIAEATIKMHVTAIFKNLDVKNRTQATIEANKRELSFA